MIAKDLCIWGSGISRTLTRRAPPPPPPNLIPLPEVFSQVWFLSHLYNCMTSSEVLHSSRSALIYPPPPAEYLAYSRSCISFMNGRLNDDWM